MMTGIYVKESKSESRDALQFKKKIQGSFNRYWYLYMSSESYADNMTVEYKEQSILCIPIGKKITLIV